MICRTLPCFEGRPGPDAPRLKRVRLPQGELAQFQDGDDPMRYLAWLELRPGTVRGNHYHERKRERFYLVAGTIQLRVEDIRTRERAELILEGGDLVVLPPGIAHALHPLREGHGIEMAPEPLDLADSFPYRIEESTRGAVS